MNNGNVPSKERQFEDPKPNNLRTTIQAIVIILILFFGLGYIVPNSIVRRSIRKILKIEDANPKIAHNMVIYEAAQKLIRARLTHPQTARFPLYLQSKITKLGDYKYKVESYFEAQNSFGDREKKDYVIELEYIGRNLWQIINLEFK